MRRRPTVSFEEGETSDGDIDYSEKLDVRGGNGNVLSDLLIVRKRGGSTKEKGRSKKRRRIVCTAHLKQRMSINRGKGEREPLPENRELWREKRAAPFLTSQGRGPTKEPFITNVHFYSAVEKKEKGNGKQRKVRTTPTYKGGCYISVEN